MKLAAAAVLVAATGVVGCTDRSLVRNASSAYQYQKAVYQHTCKVPAPPVTCPARDLELSEDFFQITASIDAIEISQGGKLPGSARTALKDIIKELGK